MDEKTKDLLVRVLDMDERELRAALIAILNGYTVEAAIDSAFNFNRREALRIFKERAHKMVR